jgi:hypothetical protein
MANNDLIKHWREVTDPRKALAEIVEHQDFLGYDPYFAEMRDALLAMAERNSKSQE